MGASKKQRKVNKFSYGMNMDSLLSQQTSGEDWRFALNAVKKTDNENDFGLASENANALHTELPSGFDVCGLAYVEESDKYVVFLHNGQENQIGIIDENLRTYTEVVNDTNSNYNLNFTFDEWIDCTVKYITKGQCKHLFVYWSNSDTYKFADLDDTCCDFSDMVLFDCICPSPVDAFVHDSGGTLYNGSYMFAVQLEDEDGNTTNFGKLGAPVVVSGNDNMPGEISDKSISLKVTGLTNRFSKINIAVVKAILGVTTVKIITNVNYGGGQFSYMYTGDTGREKDSSITEVLGRKDRYIKGKNLTQYKSRLILYNTKPAFNLDYQKTANNIVVGYNHYVLPSKMAKDYKCLRPNENYMFMIGFNYCDNTKSALYPLINRDATAEEIAMVPPSETLGNCKECEIPYWMARDTSTVDAIYINGIVRDLDIDGNGAVSRDQIGGNTSLELDAPTLTDGIPKATLNPNELDHFYKDSDLPDYSDVYQEARDTTDAQAEAQLDCACSELETLKGQISSLPEADRLAILGDAELQLLICYCNARSSLTS